MAAQFNAAQLTAFWINGPQMGLSNDQRNRLAAQGLVHPANFYDFTESMLEEAIENLKLKVDAVPLVVDPNNNNAVLQAFVPGIPATPLTAVQSGKIKVAHQLVHYYTNSQRVLTPQNMNYTAIGRKFAMEAEAVKKLAEAEEGEIPVISKTVGIMPWTERIENYTSKTPGVRGVPLRYVIRPKTEVLPEAAANQGDPFDALQQGECFGTSGSVLQELITRTSHNHPSFKIDNEKVYTILVEATKGTQYAPTVTAFSRNKNGRAAYLSLLTSHAGVDKREHEAELAQNWMMHATWNGRVYALEKWCTKHLNQAVKMEEAKTYVPEIQVPSEATRIKYMINNIHNNDPDLKAAIGLIRNNHDGARTNFETAVRMLLKVDPFKKSQGKRKTPDGHISAMSAGTGRTGVEFRWYKDVEFKRLNRAQKAELAKWRNSTEGKAAMEKQKAEYEKNKKTSHSSKKLKAQIKAAVAEARAEDAKKAKQTNDALESLKKLAMEAKATEGDTSGESSATVSSTNAKRASLNQKLLEISARLNKKGDKK